MFVLNVILCEISSGVITVDNKCVKYLSVKENREKVEEGRQSDVRQITLKAQCERPSLDLQLVKGDSRIEDASKAEDGSS